MCIMAHLAIIFQVINIMAATATLGTVTAATTDNIKLLYLIFQSGLPS